MIMTEAQRAAEEAEKEKARAIRKASLEHWTEKYRYYSHPPADKIGQNPCDKFDKMKTEEVWSRADLARKELADASLRTRPTGAFKHLICQHNSPEDEMPKRDILSFDQTMARVRNSLDISRKRTWHQNRPTWGKHAFYSGGCQSSSRYSNWMGQFSGKRQDVTANWMQTRHEDLASGRNTVRAQESYHPFRTLEFGVQSGGGGTAPAATPAQALASGSASGSGGAGGITKAGEVLARITKSAEAPFALSLSEIARSPLKPRGGITKSASSPTV